MTDLSKLKGHTPRPWIIDHYHDVDRGLRFGAIGYIALITKKSKQNIPLASIWSWNKADIDLIAAAPDLLAEVERLRERQSKHYKKLSRIGDHVDCALPKVNCAGCEDDVSTALQDINDLAFAMASEQEDK